MIKYLILIVFLAPVLLFSQSPGTIDTSFHSGWLANGQVYCAAQQTDGKILLGGDFTTFNHSRVNKIVRLNSDYTIDESFQIEGLPDGKILSLQVASDGKIIIGGNFINIGETELHHIARLNADGSIDLSFNCGTAIGPLIALGVYSSKISDIKIDILGRIYISGYFNEYDGIARNSFARLHSDGSLDLSFVPATSFTNINAFVIRPDNKLLVCPTFFVELLNSDGSKDLSFNDVNATGQILDIELLPDNSFLIGGSFSTVNGITRNRISHQYADGSTDLSFIPSTTEEVITDILLASGGGFLASGYLKIAKYNFSGTADLSFTVNNVDLTVNGMFKTADSYLIFGLFTVINNTGRNYFESIDFNGVHNHLESFHPQGTSAYNGKVYTVEKKGTDIYIGGSFYRYNGLSTANLVKTTSNGERDITFNPPAVGLVSNPTSGTVYDIQAAEGDYVLVGGMSASSEKVIKLHEIGTVDPLFNDGTGFGLSDKVRTIALQADGKYIFGGLISSYNGLTRNEMIRVSNIGTYDAQFSICCSAFNVYSVNQQADGKLLVAGDFNSGGTYKYITRTLTTLSNDEAFIPSGFSGANATVREIIQNPIDNTIYIVGDFTTVNTIVRNRICKLNADGSVDMTFNPGLGFDGPVHAIALLPDGNILVGGSFSSYNGIEMKNIACLQPDGALNTEFNFGYGTDDVIYDIELYDDYTAILGGAFKSYNTSTCDNVARIFIAAPPCTAVEIDYDDFFCEGTSYTLIDGSTVTSAGTYIATGLTADLCDSIVTYHLSMAPNFDTVINVTINEGEVYTLPNGTTVNVSGTYPVILNTILGCDSLIITNLTVVDICQAPLGVAATLITTNSAKISWSAETGATKYQIQYKPIGAGTWQKKNTTTLSKTLTGLLPNTTYQYKVKSICGASQSPFSPTVVFTTLPLRVSSDELLSVVVFPNPANNLLIVRLEIEDDSFPALVTLMNSAGQIVRSVNTSVAENLINVKDLPTGIYVVRISTSNQVFIEQIIIK